MYCFQNFRSSMSARLNFQFFSGSIDVLQKTLSLLLLREMEVEFDNARSVAVEMFLEMHDGTYRSYQTVFSSSRLSGSRSPRRIPDAPARSAPPRNTIG